jgi:hypothetical protein
VGFREALEDKKDLIIFFTYQFPLVKTHTENPTKIPPYLMTLQSLQIPLIVDLKKRKLIDKVTAKLRHHLILQSSFYQIYFHGQFSVLLYLTLMIVG